MAKAGRFWIGASGGNFLLAAARSTKCMRPAGSGRRDLIFGPACRPLSKRDLSALFQLLFDHLSGVASKLNGTANPDQGRLYWPRQPNVGFSPDSGRTAVLRRTAGSAICRLSRCSKTALVYSITPSAMARSPGGKSKALIICLPPY